MHRVLVIALAVVAATGCGGEWQPAPGPGTDGQDPTFPPEVVQKHSALQSVVSSITLPQTGKEHALDLNGDGIGDNQIGRLLGQIKQIVGIDLQGALTEQVSKGKALVLYDVLSDSLVDDDRVEVRAYVGKDQDDNPSDNFSGTETFVARAVSQNPVLPAAISAGLLSSTKPAKGLVSLPFLSHTTILSLRQTRLVAKVGSDGMRQGILAGAIHVSEAVSRLAPVLTAEINRLYRKPGQDPTLVKLINGLLDTNGDGTLSVDEFMGSSFFTFFLHSSDVDTDNDGTADSISFGVAFRSVPCNITAAD
jgi:hypothetical protein